MVKAICESDIETIDKLVDENNFDINQSIELLRGFNAITLAAELDNLEMIHYL